jgi:serine/threonine-protein kinase RsbW
MTAVAGIRKTSDVVELDVPADPAYVAVVRTATAGLAARLDLTLDRIEDLRIAVDEACTLLVHRNPPGSGGTIRCQFTLEVATLTIEVSGPAVTLPDPGAYAWAVLSALVDVLACGHTQSADEPRTWIRMTVRADTGAWS